jgi:hemerythrin-like metal-binding protein
MIDKLIQYFQGAKDGDILDHQHIEINRKHQNARTAIIEGRGMDRIIECSKELIATTLVHFRSEESAMDASPRDFTTHKRLHANMIESLRDISNDLEQRRVTGAMELMKFFEEQLTYHLDVEDAELDRELIRS